MEEKIKEMEDHIEVLEFILHRIATEMGLDYEDLLPINYKPAWGG